MQHHNHFRVISGLGGNKNHQNVDFPLKDQDWNRLKYFSSYFRIDNLYRSRSCDQISPTNRIRMLHSGWILQTCCLTRIRHPWILSLLQHVYLISTWLEHKFAPSCTCFIQGPPPQSQLSFESCFNRAGGKQQTRKYRSQRMLLILPDQLCMQVGALNWTQCSYTCLACC